MNDCNNKTKNLKYLFSNFLNGNVLKKITKLRKLLYRKVASNKISIYKNSKKHKIKNIIKKISF